MMPNETFDVDRTELSRRRGSHRHRTSAIWVLARLWKLQQVMLSRYSNSEAQIWHFFSLNDGKSNFTASVGLQVKSAKDEFFPCPISVYGSLEDVPGTAYDVRHHEIL